MTSQCLYFDDVKSQPLEVNMKQMPKGCDYQGRHPEAAECCTEIGADDAPETLGKIVVVGAAVVAVLVVIVLIAGCAA